MLFRSTDSGDLTFAKWLDTKTVGDKRVFYSVEKIGAVEILIAYPSANKKLVDQLIEKLPQILADDFGNDAIVKVFGESTKEPIRRLKPKNPRSHLAAIKTRMGNPQGNDDDVLPPSRVNTFYGRPPVTKDQVEKSYAQATVNQNDNQKSPTEINQLTKKLNDLQNEHNQLKKSLQEKDDKSILKQVDSKLKKLEESFDQKLNTSKEEWSKQMNTFFETFKQANEIGRAHV